jgi:ribulose-5-phosphate 4-epimerase/fuculose-1-phosphate aldolase
MLDEGYIKFNSQRRDGEVPYPAALDDLNRARTALFDLGLIGVLPDGIGYGNLSLRSSGLQFVVTASATGATRVLQPEHYCLVESFSVAHNRVASVGPLHASSESMTHGAIYAADSTVQCVIHVHSRVMFDWLLQKGWPSTPAQVPYGTPAMADAVSELVAQQTQLPVLFAMAGHQDGVVAYGRDIDGVFNLVRDTFGSITACEE